MKLRLLVEPKAVEELRNLEDMMKLPVEDRCQREKEIANDRHKREEQFTE